MREPPAALRPRGARAALALLALAACIDTPSATEERAAGGSGGAPVTLPGCSSDDDCADAERCLVGPPDGCDAPACTEQRHCGPSGTRRDLRPCDRGQDCASGRCTEEQVCARPCAADPTCPAGFTCRDVKLLDGSVEPSCVYEDDPAVVLCGLDAETPCADGFACALRVELDSRTAAVCLAPRPGARPNLSLCTASLSADDCAGGWCKGFCATAFRPMCGGEPTTTGDAPYFCTGPCLGDEGCPFPARCVAMSDEEFGEPLPAELRYCNASLACFDGRDCAQGDVCALVALGPSIGAECVSVEPQRAAPGAVCLVPDDCASRLCLDDGVGGKRCSELCHGPMGDSRDEWSPAELCEDRGLPEGWRCGLVPDVIAPIARDVRACLPPG